MTTNDRSPGTGTGAVATATATHDEDAPELSSTSLRIPVSGMTCAACSARVQRALQKQPGVADANVNLMMKTATVRFDPHTVSPHRLVDVIKETGYGAELASPDQSAFEEQEARDRATAEEFREPRRDVPRAMLIGCLIVAVVYLVLNWIFVANLSPERATVVFQYEKERITLGHLVSRDLIGDTGALWRLRVTPPSSIGTTAAPATPAPTPAPTPTPTPSLPGAATATTIKYRHHRYSGRVTSPQLRCYRGVSVQLRKRGKGTKSYGSTVTRQDGTWTIRRSRVKGRMYAYVDTHVAGGYRCGISTSRSIR